MPIIQEDPLRKYDADAFDFKSMKGEVTDAMKHDWKRDKVDDAKKRAIHDSRSYDEFKDRVAGCTLKPIHRNEFNAPAKYTFNNRNALQQGQTSAAQLSTEKPLVPVMSTSLDDGALASAGRSSGKTIGSQSAALSEKVPRNGHEFERELRRRTTAEDKIRLIELVLEKSGSVSRLFSRELDGEMLRQVLIAFDTVLACGAIAPGLARRFFVALATDCPETITAACSFFDAEERSTLARILARDPATEQGEDVRVCAAFGISPSSVAAAAAEVSAIEEHDAGNVAAESDSHSAQATACDGMD